MSIIVFPGQGAQFTGMGKQLFDRYPEIVNMADEHLGYSIEQLCLTDPHKQLNNTQFTQPALFTVNALHYLDFLESNDRPEYLLGHSLGEYNALLAAGAFDFQTGLRLVSERGRLMSQVSNGAMLALLKTDEKLVKDILRNSNQEKIDIANYNSPSQLVLSGEVKYINEAKKSLEENGVLCIPLKVSGAFHSRYMKSVAEEFNDFITANQYQPLQIPVIANVTASPYLDNQVIQTLTAQIYQSVRWTDSIRYLLTKGFNDFIEVGPGKILTNLINDIVKNTDLAAFKQSQPESLFKDNLKVASGNLQTTATVQEGVNSADNLGSKEFKDDYKTKYAYVAGAMGYGISSATLVAKMTNAGYLAFLATFGSSLAQIKSEIERLQAATSLTNTEFGLNLVYSEENSETHGLLVELVMRQGIRCVELSGFSEMTKELAKYRVSGLTRDAAGVINRNNKVLLKTPDHSTAELFMKPVPKHLVEQLLESGEITKEQAQLSQQIPMADDICVEGDSAWRTSQTMTIIELPAFVKMRDRTIAKLNLASSTRIGASGGLGNPESIMSAFLLGADFILTGSINQCTVEANTSVQVKDILAKLTSRDLEYIPSGEILESGRKSQVVRKGSFFAARAQKLYDLYRLHGSIAEIDPQERQQIERHFYGLSFDTVYEEIRIKLSEQVETLALAQKDPKYKMALIFKWYFEKAIELALEGREINNFNYQIFSGPAIGAFNEWVKGSELQDWNNRSVDGIATALLAAAASLLNQKSLKAG